MDPPTMRRAIVAWLPLDSITPQRHISHNRWMQDAQAAVRHPFLENLVDTVPLKAQRSVHSFRAGV